MSRSTFNERNQGTPAPDRGEAATGQPATGQAATDARARADSRPDTDDLLDAVLREMTRLDDGQADAEAARRIASVVRAASASRQAHRSGWPGELGQLAETMPRLAWATAATLLLCATVGGSLWWSTRPAAPIAPIAAVAPAAPPAAASTSASAPTSASRSSAADTATTADAASANPPRSVSPPVADASPSLASPAVAPARGGGSSPSLRALSAGRAGQGRTARAGATQRREESPDAPLGDPIAALEVASIAPALLEEPAALDAPPLSTEAIAISPIRIDPFDAPVTPRSH